LRRDASSAAPHRNAGAQGGVGWGFSEGRDWSQFRRSGGIRTCGCSRAPADNAGVVQKPAMSWGAKVGTQLLGVQAGGSNIEEGD